MCLIPFWSQWTPAKYWDRQMMLTVHVPLPPPCMGVQFFIIRCVCASTCTITPHATDEANCSPQTASALMHVILCGATSLFVPFLQQLKLSTAADSPSQRPGGLADWLDTSRPRRLFQGGGGAPKKPPPPHPSSGRYLRAEEQVEAPRPPRRPALPNSLQLRKRGTADIPAATFPLPHKRPDPEVEFPFLTRNTGSRSASKELHFLERLFGFLWLPRASAVCVSGACAAELRPRDVKHISFLFGNVA